MDATPLDLPIGLALYTVAAELRQDFRGTLRQIAEIGYRQVEMFGFYNRSAEDLRRTLGEAGLACPSALYGWSDLLENFDAALEYAHALGLKYMGCVFPALANPARLGLQGKPLAEQVGPIWDNMTLDDWKWNAEHLNLVGAKTRKAGIQLTYHNHNLEFKTFSKRSAFHWLLRLTDPKLVQIELDCGWAAAAGHDPSEILHTHAGRIALVHIKDQMPGPPTTARGPRTTEVGRGTVDWKKVFAAAKLAGVKGYFVEQEPPLDRPPLEAIKISYDFLRDLK